MHLGVQGVLRAASERLEGYAGLMQGGLAEAQALITTASHTGIQQCSDGAHSQLGIMSCGKSQRACLCVCARLRMHRCVCPSIFRECT